MRRNVSGEPVRANSRSRSFIALPFLLASHINDRRGERGNKNPVGPGHEAECGAMRPCVKNKSGTAKAVPLKLDLIAVACSRLLRRYLHERRDAVQVADGLRG